MLLPQDDGTYVMGPLDAIFIYRHVGTGRFHPIFFEEHPLPGPIKDPEEMDFVRLKSKMHHAFGFETLEAARDSVVDLRKRILIEDECVFLDPPVDWDGEVEMVVLPNWRRNGG
jgi:hypothetical protein